MKTNYCCRGPQDKSIDAKDHRIKGGTDCSSDEKPAGQEDKGSTPSTEARRQY